MLSGPLFPAVQNTERYDCPIYSRGYGIELKALFGKPVGYCMSEMERQIREALLQDDRIISVDGFTFEQPEKGVPYSIFYKQPAAWLLSHRTLLSFCSLPHPSGKSAKAALPAKEESLLANLTEIVKQAALQAMSETEPAGIVFGTCFGLSVLLPLDVFTIL